MPLADMFGSSFSDPVFDAVNAGRIARRPKQPVYEEPEEQEQDYAEPAPPKPMPKANPGILQKTGDAALGGIGMLGNFLDTPGSVVRDLATWLPGGPKPANPFDQLLPWNWTKDTGRTTGRELLRGYGMAGEDDTYGNFAGGLGAEILLDPLTYVGLGAATRAGKAASAASKAMEKTAKQAAKAAGTTAEKAGLTRNITQKMNAAAEKIAKAEGKEASKLGWLQSRMRATPSVLIKESPDPDSALKAFYEVGGTDDMLDKPIYTLFNASIPWAKWIPKIRGEGKLAQKVNSTLDKMAGAYYENVSKQPLAYADDVTKADAARKAAQSAPTVNPAPTVAAKAAQQAKAPVNITTIAQPSQPQVTPPQPVQVTQPQVQPPTPAQPQATIQPETATKLFSTPDDLLSIVAREGDDPEDIDLIGQMANYAMDRNSGQFNLKNVMEELDLAMDEGLFPDDAARIGSILQRAQQIVPTKKARAKAASAKKRLAQEVDSVNPDISGQNPAITQTADSVEIPGKTATSEAMPEVSGQLPDTSGQFPESGSLPTRENTPLQASRVPLPAGLRLLFGNDAKPELGSLYIQTYSQALATGRDKLTARREALAAHLASKGLDGEFIKLDSRWNNHYIDSLGDEILRAFEASVNPNAKIPGEHVLSKSPDIKKPKEHERYRKEALEMADHFERDAKVLESLGSKYAEPLRNKAEQARSLVAKSIDLEADAQQALKKKLTQEVDSVNPDISGQNPAITQTADSVEIPGKTATSEAMPEVSGQLPDTSGQFPESGSLPTRENTPLQENVDTPPQVPTISENQWVDTAPGFKRYKLNRPEVQADAELARLGDGTGQINLTSFAKAEGAPKGSGKAALRELAETAKEHGATKLTGIFSTHAALGALGSEFGKHNIRFFDGETGDLLKIDFAEAMKNPGKYIAEADLTKPKEFAPTKALPGTKAYREVMQKRAELGLPLQHPDDAKPELGSPYIQTYSQVLATGRDKLTARREALAAHLASKGLDGEFIKFDSRWNNHYIDSLGDDATDDEILRAFEASVNPDAKIPGEHVLSKSLDIKKPKEHERYRKEALEMADHFERDAKVLDALGSKYAEPLRNKAKQARSLVAKSIDLEADAQQAWAAERAAEDAAQAENLRWKPETAAKPMTENAMAEGFGGSFGIGGLRRLLSEDGLWTDGRMMLKVPEKLRPKLAKAMEKKASKATGVPIDGVEARKPPFEQVMAQAEKAAKNDAAEVIGHRTRMQTVSTGKKKKDVPFHSVLLKSGKQVATIDGEVHATVQKTYPGATYHFDLTRGDIHYGQIAIKHNGELVGTMMTTKLDEIDSATKAVLQSSRVLASNPAQVVAKTAAKKTKLTNEQALSSIQQALDNNDHASAYSVIASLTRDQINQLSHTLFGSGFYKETKAEMLEQIAKVMPKATKDAVAATKRANEIFAAESALKKAKQNQSDHARGLLGAPIREGVPEVAYKDPHGAGKEAAAKAWQDEVDDAQRAVDKATSKTPETIPPGAALESMNPNPLDKLGQREPFLPVVTDGNLNAPATTVNFEAISPKHAAYQKNVLNPLLRQKVLTDGDVAFLQTVLADSDMRNIDEALVATKMTPKLASQAKIADMSQALGFHDWPNKRIAINPKSHAKHTRTEVLLHELGHHVFRVLESTDPDLYNAAVKAFYKIPAKDLHKYFKDAGENVQYYLSHEHEAFAQMFANITAGKIKPDSLPSHLMDAVKKVWSKILEYARRSIGAGLQVDNAQLKTMQNLVEYAGGFVPKSERDELLKMLRGEVSASATKAPDVELMQSAALTLRDRMSEATEQGARLAKSFQDWISKLPENMADSIADAVAKGENMIGAIPGVREAIALFDRNVMGATGESAQMLGRKATEVIESAHAAVRQAITPLVRSIEGSNYFSEAHIVEELGVTAEEASRIANERSFNLKAFVEDINPMFYDTNKMPPEVADIATKIRQMLDDTLEFEARKAGLNVANLRDEYASYSARIARKPGRQYARNPLSGPQLDTEFPSMKSRESFLKNLPGGTAVVDELSVDPKISGIVNRAPVIDKTLKKAKKFEENAAVPDTAALRVYLYENYGPKLSGQFFDATEVKVKSTGVSWQDAWQEVREELAEELKNTEELLKDVRKQLKDMDPEDELFENLSIQADDLKAQVERLNPETNKQFDQLINWTTTLDPSYVTEQSPLFGRNVLYDTMQRMQDGQSAAHVALAAQRHMGENLRRGATTEDQGVAFSKLLETLKLDSATAYENIIKHMSQEHLDEHAEMLQGTVDEILEKIASAGDEEIVLHRFKHQVVDATPSTIARGPSKGIGVKMNMQLVHSADGDLIVREVFDDGRYTDYSLENIIDDDLAHLADEAGKDSIAYAIETLVRQDVDQKFLKDFNAPKQVHDDMTRWMKPFSNPDEIDWWRRGLNRFMNVFRGSVTAPFPSFHVRNFVSGQAQNFFFRAFDPNAPFSMSYFKPIKDAWTMRDGKAIVNLHKEIDGLISDDDVRRWLNHAKAATQKALDVEARKATPTAATIEALRKRLDELSEAGKHTISSNKLSGELLDRIATDKLAEEIFSQALIGSKQGQAAEIVGDTTSLLKSQMPGIHTANPLRGIGKLLRGDVTGAAREFSPAPPGTTLTEALTPTAFDGGFTVGFEGMKPTLQAVDSDRFVLARWGRDMGSLVEDLNRISPYIAFRKQGFTAKAAGEKVKTIQIDYTKLSSFERRHMRTAIPFYCVPTDHEILTRDGWKTYDQLKLGEDVLAYEPTIDRTFWTPLLEVATFDFDGELMQWETSRKGKKINFQFTENHRWPVKMTSASNWRTKDGKRHRRVNRVYQTIKEAIDIPTGARLIGAAPLADLNETSCLSPRHAAILGAVVKCVARLGFGPKCNTEMMVYQSPSKFLDEIIELLGTKPRKPHPTTGVICVNVRASDVREILKVFKGKQSLSEIVTRLDTSAAKAMLEAMDKAESSYTNSNLSFAQSATHNPHVRDAYQILRFLCGQVANLSQKCCYVRKNRHYNWTNKTVSRVPYKGKIWCPRTHYGTWVMRHNGNVVITGNTFTSRALMMTAGDLIKNPGGRQAQTIRAINLMRDRETPTPEYIQNSLSIPLGELDDGSKRYITGFGLALEDSAKFTKLFGGDVGGTLKEIGSRMNPLIKGPIEAMMGRSLFYDGPSGPQELSELDPPIGRTLSNIRDLATGQRTERATPFISQGFEHIMSNTPFARYATVARQATDPRKWDAPLGLGLDLMTGVKVKDVSPAAQDSLATQRAAQMFRELGGRNITMPYFPKEKIEQLPEEDKQTVKEIQELLNTVKERRKLRREMEEAKIAQAR